MSHEIALFGLFFPSVVLCAVIAGVIWYTLDSVLIRFSAWAWFWHPPLARLALYFILFGAVSALYPDF